MPPNRRAARHLRMHDSTPLIECVGDAWVAALVASGSWGSARAHLGHRTLREAHGGKRVRRDKHVEPCRARRRRHMMAVLMRAELQGVTQEQVRPIMAEVEKRITSFPGFISQARG